MFAESCNQIVCTLPSDTCHQTFGIFLFVKNYFSIDTTQTETLQLLQHSTGLQAQWDEAEKKLQGYILYLLEKDIQSLYNLLYRIDVSETKVRAIFGGFSEDIATDITRLILERIQQKAELRLRYKNKKP